MPCCCDAPLLSGQATLEYLEQRQPVHRPAGQRAALVPLSPSLCRFAAAATAPAAAPRLQGMQARSVAELHIRASQWYEDNGLEIEAFQHAAAANDVERAERLIEGEGVPLHFRGAGAPVLNWLESLPKTVLDARPSLWVTYASVLMMTGQHTAVEQKLQAAEAALQGTEARRQDPRPCRTDCLHAGHVGGHSARCRNHHCPVAPRPGVSAPRQPAAPHCRYLYAGVCLSAPGRPCRGQPGLCRSHRDQYSRLGLRSTRQRRHSVWARSRKQTTSCLWRPRPTGASCMLAGDPPRPIACEAHLGLARISYQWNDLDAAEQHGQQCLQLTRQMESVDTFASYGVFLARLKLAQGDLPGAVAVLDEAEAFVRQHNFVFRMPDVAAAQVLVLLRQGNLAAAAQLAADARAPDQPGPRPPGPGRPGHGTGGAGAIAPAGGGKGLGG